MDGSGRAVGLKYAAIAHIAAEEWWPDDGVAKRLAASYGSAGRAYFVSQATLELSRRQFGSSIRNAQLVRNPFNVRYEARPDWRCDKAEGLSLACVGRLDVAAKGQDLLLDILSLPHWRERDVHVSLVGEGANGQLLRRAARELGLTNVEFLGYSNDVEKIWSQNHALVLPSRREGMPLALVEAMLCGRPAIVTDVGGNRELVRDGVNGFLAKAPTVELLDEALNRAWAGRKQLREMGNVAAEDVRRWVSQNPGEEFVQELLDLVDDTRVR